MIQKLYGKETINEYDILTYEEDYKSLNAT